MVCFDTVCRAGKLDEYTNGNLEEFFHRLGAGDERAAALWDVYLDHLASAIYNIRILFDCKSSWRVCRVYR